MVKYLKPNGEEIEVTDNEDTRDYVKSLGWKEVKPKKAPKLKAVKNDNGN